MKIFTTELMTLKDNIAKDAENEKHLYHKMLGVVEDTKNLSKDIKADDKSIIKYINTYIHIYMYIKIFKKIHYDRISTVHVKVL